MEAKFRLAITISKLFFRFVFLTLFSLSFYSISLGPFSINFNYFNIGLGHLIGHSFCFGLSDVSNLFILIVSFVTSLVLLYREVYIEHYNNFKFIFLLIIFFLSMAILSTRESLLNLMLGWDGLGVSSLCLIIFYPNKNTLYNSLLTMFFNRLGDVILILVLSLYIIDYSLFFRLGGTRTILIRVLIFRCALTKRAQFPLSSWLPAAMSAPTPISAMVHSSTLVTAGVFVCRKSYWFFSSNFISLLFLFLRVSSFLIGGLIANFELDLKKTIAFSTMRQIRIIMFFTASARLTLALTHIIYHALFKTALFCCAGCIFIGIVRDQLSSAGKSPQSGFVLKRIFFLSLFSITGLIFSSSFYTKDLILEFYRRNLNFLFFLCLFAGGCLTLSYSSKLFFRAIIFVTSIKFVADKKFSFRFFYFFSLTMVILSVFLKDLIFVRLPSHLSNVEVGVINLIFLLCLISKLPFVKFNINLLYTIRVSFIKLYTFRIGSRIYSTRLIEFSFRDRFVFKPYLFYEKFKNFPNINFKLLPLAVLSFLFCV